VRRPKYLQPSAKNYENHLKEIKQYCETHKDENVLSIQMFACHGMIKDGCQNVLVNNFNLRQFYYELIPIEFLVRVGSI